MIRKSNETKGPTMSNTATSTVNTETEVEEFTPISSRVIIKEGNIPTQRPLYSEKLQKSCEALNVKFVSGIPETIPQGFNIAILPYTDIAKPGYKKGEALTKIVAYVATIMPTLENLLSTEAGRAFVNTAVNTALGSKVLTAVKTVLKDNVHKATDPNYLGRIELPMTVEEYLEKKRGRFDLSVWKEDAPTIVKSFAEHRNAKITQPELQRVLQNATFAQRNYPLVPQETWKKLLAMLIQRANAAGKSPGIYEHWLLIRDQAQEDAVLDFNLDDMFGDSGTAGDSGDHADDDDDDDDDGDE